MSKPRVSGKENELIPFEGLETERIEGHVEEICCFWIAGSTFALQQPTMQEDLWAFHPSSTAQQWTRIFLLRFVDEEARMAWHKTHQPINISLSRAVTSCRPWSTESRLIKINQDVKKMRSKCGNRCPRHWKVQKHQWNVMTYNATKMQSQNATVCTILAPGSEHISASAGGSRPKSFGAASCNVRFTCQPLADDRTRGTSWICGVMVQCILMCI